MENIFRKNGDVEDKHSHSQRRTWHFPQWLREHFEQDLYNKYRQIIYHTDLKFKIYS